MSNKLHNSYALVGNHLGIISYLKFDNTYHFSNFETGEYYEIEFEQIHAITKEEYKEIYKQRDVNGSLYNNIVKLRAKGVTRTCKHSLKFCEIIAKLKLDYMIQIDPTLNDPQMSDYAHTNALNKLYDFNHKFFERLSLDRVVQEEIIEVIHLYYYTVPTAEVNINSIKNQEFEHYYKIFRKQK